MPFPLIAIQVRQREDSVEPGPEQAGPLNLVASQVRRLSEVGSEPIFPDLQSAFIAWFKADEVLANYIGSRIFTSRPGIGTEHPYAVVHFGDMAPDITADDAHCDLDLRFYAAGDSGQCKALVETFVSRFEENPRDPLLWSKRSVAWQEAARLMGPGEGPTWVDTDTQGNPIYRCTLAYEVFATKALDD